jgi:hypothetical protein
MRFQLLRNLFNINKLVDPIRIHPFPMRKENGLDLVWVSDLPQELRAYSRLAALPAPNFLLQVLGFVRIR